jgi:hypothetical protein
MKRQRSIFKTVIAPIVVLVVAIPTLALVVYMVLHGRGAESYSNVYGANQILVCGERRGLQLRQNPKSALLLPTCGSDGPLTTAK